MLASGSRWALWTALLGSAAGCNKAWHAETMTPPIRFGASLEARTSFPAVIATRDMELPRWVQLPNSVYFVAVSRDRLRFHVTLHHKWEDMTDPRRWRVWIEDDTGGRYNPVGVDRRAVKSVTRSYERPTGQWSAQSYQVSMYKGDGDYVFHRHNLVRRDMRYLVLVMQRPGYEYRYRWSFVDDEGAPLPLPTAAQEPMARSGRCVRPGSKCGPIIASPSRTPPRHR